MRKKRAESHLAHRPEAYVPTLPESRGRSEYAPAFGVRLSAAFLPTLLYQLNSWLFSRLQPHRGFPPKREIGNSHKLAYRLKMLFKTMSAIGCAVACLSATAFADDAYKFLSEIPIGGEGGWDILTIDAARAGFICRTRPRWSWSIWKERDCRRDR